MLTLCFQFRYRKWCERNKFESMLPKDAKKRKAPVPDKSRQSSVTDHFGLEDTDAKPIPYSDDTFKTAALEWLIETNQVRLGFQYIILPILSYNVITAHPDLQPSRLQKDARHRIPCQEKHQPAIAQTVEGFHPQDVQTATLVIAGSPHGMFHLRITRLRILIHKYCNILGPHCQRRN
jgi:hypothetical protein